MESDSYQHLEVLGIFTAENLLQSLACFRRLKAHQFRLSYFLAYAFPDLGPHDFRGFRVTSNADTSVNLTPANIPVIYQNFRFSYLRPPSTVIWRSEQRTIPSGHRNPNAIVTAFLRGSRSLKLRSGLEANLHPRRFFCQVNNLEDIRSPCPVPCLCRSRPHGLACVRHPSTANSSRGVRLHGRRDLRL